MQAKIEHQKKNARYHSESLKYWNREVSAKRGRERIASGLARARSDTYVKALHTLGQARQNQAKAAIELMQLPSGQNDYRPGEALSSSGVSRSRTYGRQKHLAVLDKQASLESQVDSTFRRNMDGNMQKIDRYYKISLARNREKLGVKPEYGAPVMMPPRGNTMFANLGTFLSIASLAATASAASDIKLKENIEEVGKSPKGYKIYEWNYKSDKNTRYRGAIAQDVVKINPMAVGIRDNYLTVNYNKIDVNMEVIS